MGDSKAPSTDRTISSAAVTASPLPSAKAAAAASTAAPEVRSSPTMMARRSIRSASTPPNGVSKIVGTMLTASSVPNTAAEPVFSSTYIDSANRSAPLPSRENTCPRSRRVKFRVNSFSFIVRSSFYIHFKGMYLNESFGASAPLAYQPNVCISPGKKPLGKRLL